MEADAERFGNKICDTQTIKKGEEMEKAKSGDVPSIKINFIKEKFPLTSCYEADGENRRKRGKKNR